MTALVPTNAAVTDGGAPSVHLVLRLSGVRAGYGEVAVLHGIDLEIRHGAISAVIGPNGAGKSTLAGVVSGAHSATGGSIEFEGRDVTTVPEHRRSHDGMLLIPESRGIFPGLTVDENLEVWLPAAEDREICYRHFPHLAERKHLLAGSLSGGEQQILGFGPLVTRPPKLLIVDEPTLGLAPLIVRELLRVLVGLRDEGVAILLIEEKTRDVLEIADDVAILKHGQVAWAGPRRMVTNDRITELYLGA